MTIINGAIFLLLLIIIVFLIKRYLKDYKIYESEKDKLFDYLSIKGDTEALKELGGINLFEVKEKWHVSSRTIREYINSRDDLLKEEEIIRFILIMDNFDKSYISNFILSFILLFILILIMF